LANVRPDDFRENVDVARAEKGATEQG